MSKTGYKFDHRCKNMPTTVDFLQLDFSETSQFTFSVGIRPGGNMTATLYGFRYCPYCGEKVMDGD